MAALSRAIRNKRWRQARLLIEAGSDVNWRGDNKRTPLMEVCFLDDEEKALGLAKMLLENGAELGCQDAKGLNPLSYACLLKQKKLVDLFLQFVDYDLNSVDQDENTALFHAITVGDVSIVKTLVQKLKYYGLAVDTVNSKGETPLIHALKTGRMQCADVLIQDGKASLEARDMVHYKSAAQWKNEMQRKGKRTISAFVVENEPKSNVKQTSKMRKTVSAKIARGTALPRIAAGKKPIKSRPFTAPDRIPVSDFFNPSTPVQEDLLRLYGIYNQQTTSSYRKGYKTILPAAKKLPTLTEEINEGSSETSEQLDSGKARVSARVSAKLKGLHKSVKNRKNSASPLGGTSPSLNSEGSQVGSEETASKSGRRSRSNSKSKLRNMESKDSLVSLSSEKN